MTRYRQSGGWLRKLSLALIVVGVGGCAQENLGDLQVYVDQVKARNPGRIEPLPEIEVYESYAYAAEGLRDPFTRPASREQREQEEQTASTSGISPDFNRPRELLEEYPLDALRMVGTLEQDQRVWAIVKASDGTIHRVVTGNYMGQNYGQILQIGPAEIQLKEIIPDGLGGWQEREAALALGGEQP